MSAFGPIVESLDATCGVLLAALGRQSLYAAVVFVLALGAARLLRRAPARVHAALWTLVLVRLLLPPDLSAPWSARSLLGIGPLSESVPAAHAESGSLDALAHRGASEAAAVPSGGLPALGPRPANEAGFPWALAVTLLWLTGALTVAGGLLRRRRRYERIARGAEAVTDRHALERFDEARRRLGVARPVRLVTGRDAAPAFTLGLRRPRVYVPRSYLRAGAAPSPRRDEALDAALAHELAHVRAMDDLWLRLRAVVQALFFFHPLAWTASARHAEARELAADERVVASGALTPRAYGRGFLAALRLGPPDSGPELAQAAPALAADRRRLQMRIERILEDTSTRRRVGRMALPALLALSCLVLPMAWAAPGPAPAPGSTGATVQAAAAPAAVVPAAYAAPTEIPGFDPASAWRVQLAFLNPIPESKVTSKFGSRWNPVRAENDHHDGIDLAAAEGTPVMAPETGVVRVATQHYSGGSDWGTVVVLEHANGYETFHAHLGSLSVIPGQRVVKGDEIGTVGATGRTTGPHLHFEVRKDGEPVDPQALIDGC